MARVGYAWHDMAGMESRVGEVSGELRFGIAGKVRRIPLWRGMLMICRNGDLKQIIKRRPDSERRNEICNDR